MAVNGYNLGLLTGEAVDVTYLILDFLEIKNLNIQEHDDNKHGECLPLSLSINGKLDGNLSGDIKEDLYMIFDFLGMSVTVEYRYDSLNSDGDDDYYDAYDYDEDEYGEYFFSENGLYCTETIINDSHIRFDKSTQNGSIFSEYKIVFNDSENMIDQVKDAFEHFDFE